MGEYSFGHTFMRIEIFIFHSNIFIFFVEYFICSRIFHPARLLKTIFRQRAVFARPAIKSQMYTTHIALIHYINSKAFAQNPYMENVSASFPKDIFCAEICVFLTYLS